MSRYELYDNNTGMLSIVSDEMEAEFKVATRQAVEDMQDDFEFYGYTVETCIAVTVVQDMDKRRTYH